MFRAYIRYILKAILPRLGGKQALIKPITHEIFLCQTSNTIDAYVEPFGGAASILFHCYCPSTVVYNEYDRNLCALFKVVQHGGEPLDRLVNILQSAAYCQENFDEAKEMSVRNDIDDVEQAMCVFMLSKMSILNMMQTFKYYSEDTPELWERNHEKNVAMVRGYFRSIDNLYNFHHRLQEVEIINGDFRDILRKYQNCETALIYADPPYEDRDDYNNGWTRKDRVELVDILLECKCKVILSGYDTPMYNERLADSEVMNARGWKRKDLGEFAVASTKGKRRHEYLWLNY